MKNIKLYTLLSLLFLFSCNDAFLEKNPIESQTEATAFKTYDNFKTFSWSLYSAFSDESNYTQGLSTNFGNYEGDHMAGYLALRNTSDGNRYRTQTAIAPSSGGGWHFSFIRKVNLMLGNIDNPEMTDTEHNYWAAL